MVTNGDSERPDPDVPSRSAEEREETAHPTLRLDSRTTAPGRHQAPAIDGPTGTPVADPRSDADAAFAPPTRPPPTPTRTTRSPLPRQTRTMAVLLPKPSGHARRRSVRSASGVRRRWKLRGGSRGGPRSDPHTTDPVTLGDGHNPRREAHLRDPDTETVVIEADVIPRRLRRPIDLLRMLTAFASAALILAISYFASAAAAGLESDLTKASDQIPG